MSRNLLINITFDNIDEYDEFIYVIENWDIVKQHISIVSMICLLLSLYIVILL